VRLLRVVLFSALAEFVRSCLPLFSAALLATRLAILCSIVRSAACCCAQVTITANRNEAIAMNLGSGNHGNV
jgi:hypothetical protein